MSGILSIFAVTEHKHQGADEFIAPVVEGAQERILGRRHLRPRRRRPDPRAGAGTAHGFTIPTIYEAARIVTNTKTCTRDGLLLQFSQILKGQNR